MTNSSQDGCFSSVLRRLICAGGLPTHPSASDNEQENYSTVKLPPPPPSPTPTTTPAGVVARLMGIDSFPNSPKLVSFMRKSRSVGSREFFLPNFPHSTTHRHNSHIPHHRRVTTSVSFRELRPSTTLFLYDHTGNKSDDMRNLTPIQLEKSNNLRKSDMGLTPVQEKSNNLLRGRIHTNHAKNSNSNSSNKKNTNTVGKRGQSQRLKALKNNEQEIQVSSVSKIRSKRGVNAAAKKKKKKLVIDDGFPDEQLMYKSRDTRYNHPLPYTVKHKKKKNNKKSILLKRRSESHDEYSQEYCMKALVEVCSLTMAEIDEGGVWVDTKVMGVNNLQEVSYQVAQHILYVLVYDMVDELCNS